MLTFFRDPVQIIVVAVAFLFVATLGPSSGDCTRDLYLGKEEMVVAGRLMDWKEDVQSNLWFCPRAMPRDGGLCAVSGGGG